MSAAGIENGYLILRAPLLRRQDITAVSFEILLGILYSCSEFVKDFLKEESPSDPNRFQLVELQGFVDIKGGFHAAPLGGTASPALADWVEGVYTNRDRLEEVEEAMFLAWNTMGVFKVRKQKGPNPYGDFRAHFRENGAFFLNCVGNACSLDTMDWWTRGKGEGHDLGCHNLDAPAQQLCLISGLAAMLDIADKEITSKPPAT